MNYREVRYSGNNLSSYYGSVTLTLGVCLERGDETTSFESRRGTQRQRETDLPLRSFPRGDGSPLFTLPGDTDLWTSTEKPGEGVVFPPPTRDLSSLWSFGARGVVTTAGGRVGDPRRALLPLPRTGRWVFLTHWSLYRRPVRTSPWTGLFTLITIRG